VFLFGVDPGVSAPEGVLRAHGPGESPFVPLLVRRILVRDVGEGESLGRGRVLCAAGCEEPELVPEDRASQRRLEGGNDLVAGWIAGKAGLLERRQAPPSFVSQGGAEGAAEVVASRPRDRIDYTSAEVSVLRGNVRRPRPRLLDRILDEEGPRLAEECAAD